MSIHASLCSGVRLSKRNKASEYLSLERGSSVDRVGRWRSDRLTGMVVVGGGVIAKGEGVLVSRWGVLCRLLSQFLAHLESKRKMQK